MGWGQTRLAMACACGALLGCAESSDGARTLALQAECWEAHPVPDTIDGAGEVFDVAAAEDGVLGIGPGALLRHDGSGWTALEDRDLYPESLAANAGGDIWLLGSGEVSQYRTTLIRWDDALSVPAWLGMDSFRQLRALHVDDDGDAWVVGNERAPGAQAAQEVLLTGDPDGAGVRAFPTPEGLAAYYVTGRGGDIYVAGVDWVARLQGDSLVLLGEMLHDVLAIETGPGGLYVLDRLQDGAVRLLRIGDTRAQEIALPVELVARFMASDDAGLLVVGGRRRGAAGAALAQVVGGSATLVDGELPFTRMGPMALRDDGRLFVASPEGVWSGGCAP